MATHMTVKRLIALACVVAAAAFAASAQTRELNPTVKVLARPQGLVPAECATDPATVPALEAEAPALEPVTAPGPPSNDLRASLRRLQVAAEGNDYAVFKSALAEARRAVAAHPAGGERNAANDALQVFADIGRLWDYAMTAPTGAFFDSTAQGGSLLNALKRYPDYGRAIADQTITSGGRTLYPTPETRRFLARESGRRLTRLGVSTPARVARGAQPEPAPRRTVVAPPPVKKPVQVAAKTARTKKSPKTPAPKPAVKIAKATPPKTKTVAIKATPLPKSKPTAPFKVADTSTMPPGPPIVSTPRPPAPTTTTTATPVQTTTTAPVTTTTAPVTTTTAASTTDTAVVTTSFTTDTSVTAAPDTATTGTAVPAPKQNGNMNLILAVVLILVGIGVLVVLFRASD
jgi:hypothetical protein